MKRTVALSSAIVGLSMVLLAETEVRAECRGGHLWTDQGSKITIIAGDGIPDPFQVFPLGVKGENYTFAITDSESTVLVYTKDNTFDLEGAGEGTCLVYGIAYSGEFDMPTGVSVDELEAEECLSLSRDHITVNRLPDGSVDGGWVLNDVNGGSRVLICLNNDPLPLRAYSYNAASSSSSYAFIITDYEGNVLAYPEGNQMDFGAAPPGTCRIYGISFTGELLGETGIPVEEVISSEDNQDLSRNYIRVVRKENCRRGGHQKNRYR